MLPTPRAFLTSLISSLPTPTTAHGESGTANPLSSLRGRKRTALLTLHVLFPAELLPALDLLDRGCVTRLHVCEDDAKDADAEDADADAAQGERANAQGRHARRKGFRIYHVRSAAAHRSGSRYNTYTHAEQVPSYEVRLDAWNCSCPAFAFAAFTAAAPGSPPGGAEGEAEAEADGSEQADREARDMNTTGVDTRDAARSSDDAGYEDGYLAEWTWGGHTVGTHSAPVCKHLLACVLVEKSALFADMVEEKTVGIAEAAGWGA